MSLQEEEIWNTEICTQGEGHEHEGRYQSDFTASQGMPKIVSKPLGASGEARTRFLPTTSEYIGASARARTRTHTQTPAQYVKVLSVLECKCRDALGSGLMEGRSPLYREASSLFRDT